MVPLNPGKQRSYVATIPLLLAAAFIVAVHSDCGVPPRFPFAALREEYRNQTQFAAGSSVEYDCRPGYIKKRSSTLRCMTSSKWFDIGEFCKARSCLHPGEPENGRLVILTNLMFGATVQFTCEEGYRLIGASERKCVLEGSQVAWDREIPYCQVIPCLPPPEIEHGTHTGTTMEEFNYGTSVTYQCDTVKRGQVPFSLIGEPSIHCTSTDNVNGDWSGPAPECKVIRCQQPNIDHGKQMTGYSPLYTYRASVLFECEHRYTLKGSNLLQCNENSRWDPQLPVCERSSCDDPPYISNTVKLLMERSLFPAGTVVNYNCERGYELIPGISSASVTCQKDFTWSKHEEEFCQRIKCPYPEVTNGAANPEKKTYVYGDKIHIQCDRDYALRNKYQLKCEDDGTWYPALPICEPVCEPPALSHGEHNRGQEKVFLGSHVTYNCHQGWSLVGVPTIRCIAGDGGISRWDAPAPECRACEPPARINNGRDSRDNRWYGWQEVFLLDSRVTYSCHQGWSLVGVPTIRCIAGDGGIPHWDAPVPECKACEPPARINNGRDNRRQEKVFLVDSHVTYTCDEDWSLVGVPTIQCIAGEGGIPRWHPPVPQCKVTPRCPNPVIENGKQVSRSKNKFRPGDNVEFQCDSNYILQGSRRIECQENGMWNSPVPSCIKACKPPAQISHGRDDRGQREVFPVGSNVTYICDKDWSLVGVPSIQCIAGDGRNPQWHAPAPECKVGCPKPDLQNGGMVNALDEKTWYNMNESITLKCSPGYQFSDYWYLSTTGSLNIACSANGTWSVLPKCEKLIQSPLCNMVRESVKLVHCGVSLTELKTRLEVQKLSLEIQKLHQDLQKYNE